MSNLSVSRIGTAVAGFALALTSFGTAGANPMRVNPGNSSALAATRTRSIVGHHTGERRRNSTTPVSCSTNYATYSFIGIGGANEVAGGDEAAVLGGYGNEACDADDGIGGGYLNAIGNSGNADWSSIGGGQSNGITAPNSFVGAGADNTVSGYGKSFVGSGSYNSMTGQEAFDGSGGDNTVSGDDAAVIAGSGNTASGFASFVGVGESNVASNDLSFVAAGEFNTASGLYSFVGAGDHNTASGYYSFSAAGYGNTASAEASFVGGGEYESVTGSGSFIGSGDYTYSTACRCTTIGNTVSGVDSFLGSGDQNVVSGNEAFLGGGNQNGVSATEAFLGGGFANTIASTAAFSTVAGGNSNASSGEYEAIGGGYDNIAKGADATIPGGNRNEAYGELSFAAGYQAHALYTGSFVWSDYVSGESPINDSASDEFVARASGGVYFFSNAGKTAGVHLAAGSGTWASLSDRNAKTDVVPLDDASILSKVASLPISAWRYKTEHGVRHVGPMAQDFYAAFGVGEDDRHITSIDEDGVALAAIKALRSQNESLEHEIADLHRENRARAVREAVEDQRIAMLMRAMHVPNAARGR